MEISSHASINIHDLVNYDGQLFKVKGKGNTAICLGQNALQEVWVPWHLFDLNRSFSL